jgi:Outer membrane lipoprotein carrier protein LolA-like
MRPRAGKLPSGGSHWLPLAWMCAVALCGAAVTGRAETANPAAFDQLLQLFAARHHGHVSFTEVHELAMLKRPLQSSGELLYDAPDHLEKRTLSPRPETLTLDHGILTAQRGSHRRQLPLKDYPQVVPFVESIRATLAGDRAALERYFRVQFNGTLEDWSLLLTPVDPQVSRSVQQIRLAGSRERLHSVEISLTDGDRSLLTIGADISP